MQQVDNKRYMSIKFCFAGWGAKVTTVTNFWRDFSGKDKLFPHLEPD